MSDLAPTMFGARLFVFIAFILPGILSVSHLLQIACSRNPTAPFCGRARARSSSLLVEPPPNLFLRDSTDKKHSAGILIDDLEASAPQDRDLEQSTTPKS
uniref:Secreted protein n=1 Tax=Steinernema glaseri TaxID=37863 RepID=A0A1I7YR66_9BILA